MNKGKIVLLSVLGVLLLILLYGFSTYNSLVGKQQNVEAAWGKVQVTYQRRADLVPNLVSTVKGAAAHEKSTLQALTDARAKVGSLNISADDLTEENLKKFQAAQNELSKAMKSLIAVGEAYPNIKGTENFRDLQVQLESTENRVSTARMDYTAAVKDYNNVVMKFPSNIVAGICGYEKKPQFEADEAAQTAPKVDFEQ